MQETPEQVCEQMAKKLFEYKKQHQEEKRQQIEDANEKQRRENTDDLRLVDSKF